MRKKLAGLALIVAATMALPSVANAITVADFDKKSREEQAQIITKTVETIVDFYENRKPDKEKLGCVLDLYTRPEPEGTMRGTELFVDELEKARKDNPEAHHIEMLIFGMISRECPTPAASPTR